MTNQPFDSTAAQVGIVCALVALPFALGIGTFAAKVEFIKTLFFGQAGSRSSPLWEWSR